MMFVFVLGEIVDKSLAVKRKFPWK